MPDWFENPAVRRHFGLAGLDWKIFQTEVDTEDDITEEIPDTPDTDTEVATGDDT
ncbi:hypothetical protein [Streptomyces sp. NPDC001601]|uniref:hypothetical protein n=1 Tax=Streptomyces sp. NPDC001601 TaxID=3364592 RepID=UPI0036A74D61